MTRFRTNLLPALISGLLLSAMPAFADDEDFADFTPPAPPEFAFTVGLPLAELPESGAILAGEELPVGLPIEPASGFECSAKPPSLTDDQLEKIHSFKNDFLDAVGPKKLAIASKKRKLRDSLLSANIDASEAKSLQGEINALTAEVNNLKLENKINCLNVLTEEQRKDIRNRMLRFQCRPGHHHFGRMRTMGRG